MLSIVDPSADVVWEAVYTVVTDKGVDERFPRNDEEWANVRRGAIRLVEATNLLLMPGRHVARPGEKSEAPGVELAPAQMEELIEKDAKGWKRHVAALHAAATEALQAIDKKDVSSMLEIGEHIERACEGCHQQYWYPNQQLPPGYGTTNR